MLVFCIEREYPGSNTAGIFFNQKPCQAVNMSALQAALCEAAVAPSRWSLSRC